MSALSLAFDTPDLARKYEERSVDRQFRHGQQLIAALGVRPGDHVLDLGAGTGLLAEHVADVVGQSGTVLGIDPLPLRIEIARRRTRPNLSFEVGNAYSLDQLPAGRFDVVYLNQVLHWLPEKAGPLAEVRRLLKPGGRVGIATGSRNHPNQLQLIKTQVLSGEPYRQHSESRQGAPHWVSVAELAQLLEGAGLEPTRIELQGNVQFQPDPGAAIDFVEASSFGNFLGHLPLSLRARATEEIRLALEPLRTKEGIRLENKRILAVAQRPVAS